MVCRPEKLDMRDASTPSEVLQCIHAASFLGDHDMQSLALHMGQRASYAQDRNVTAPHKYFSKMFEGVK